MIMHYKFERKVKHALMSATIVAFGNDITLFLQHLLSWLLFSILIVARIAGSRGMEANATDSESNLSDISMDNLPVPDVNVRF